MFKISRWQSLLKLGSSFGIKNCLLLSVFSNFFVNSFGPDSSGDLKLFTQIPKSRRAGEYTLTEIKMLLFNSKNENLN